MDLEFELLDFEFELADLGLAGMVRDSRRERSSSLSFVS